MPCVAACLALYDGRADGGVHFYAFKDLACHSSHAALRDAGLIDAVGQVAAYMHLLPLLLGQTSCQQLPSTSPIHQLKTSILHNNLCIHLTYMCLQPAKIAAHTALPVAGCTLSLTAQDCTTQPHPFHTTACHCCHETQASRVSTSQLPLTSSRGKIAVQHCSVGLPQCCWQLSLISSSQLHCYQRKTPARPTQPVPHQQCGWLLPHTNHPITFKSDDLWHSQTNARAQGPPWTLVR